MWKYIGTRTAQMFLTFLLFQAATFFLLELQPGDIADRYIANPNIPPSEVVRMREELGLDGSVIERFGKYLGNFYTGNWGTSLSDYPTPVAEIIGERLPRTLTLFLTSTLVAFWFGYRSGKLLAWRRGTAVEYVGTVVGVILYTVFTPWFALMMIWLFALKLEGWTEWVAERLEWFPIIDLPAGKFLDPRKMEWILAPVNANYVFNRMLISTLAVVVIALIGLYVASKLDYMPRRIVRLLSFILPAAGLALFWMNHEYGVLAFDIAVHLILPILTLTLISYAGFSLLMRTSMLETLREDYIQTAKAKGLPDRVIRDKHAARNAMLPVWTSLVFAIGNSVAGGIITEAIFSWPGLGQTYLKSVSENDIPLAMGTLTMFGIMTLISHLVADVGYAFLDPRIRYGGEK